MAKTYFGSEDNMIRVDMSEYQDKKSIAKLIGNIDEGVLNGQLTDAVRRNPFSLVLLDELEKAHPDLFNIFLQVLDDGRLTDAMGNTVNFTNVILIATSNVGSLQIQEYFKQGLSAVEIREKLMDNELLKYFRPEFLNRFDQICVFHPLAHQHLRQITDLLLKDLQAKLLKKRIHLEWDQQFVDQFVKKHYSFEMGARPIRRAIQEEIADSVAEKMLKGELRKTQRVVFGEKGILIGK